MENWNDMHYKLSGYDYRDVSKTVIIDEVSMLTEEMFGALVQALKVAKRIIFIWNSKFYEDRLAHKTVRGGLVRSKSEVAIANALYYHNLEYIYEPELELEGRIKRQDFKVVDDDTGEEWYRETLRNDGRSQVQETLGRKESILQEERHQGRKNLIVTYDENGPLDSRKVEEIIQDIFGI